MVSIEFIKNLQIKLSQEYLLKNNLKILFTNSMIVHHRREDYTTHTYINPHLSFYSSPRLEIFSRSPIHKNVNQIELMDEIKYSKIHTNRESTGLSQEAPRTYAKKVQKWKIGLLKIIGAGTIVDYRKLLSGKLSKHWWGHCCPFLLGTPMGADVPSCSKYTYGAPVSLGDLVHLILPRLCLIFNLRHTSTII